MDIDSARAPFVPGQAAPAFAPVAAAPTMAAPAAFAPAAALPVMAAPAQAPAFVQAPAAAPQQQITIPLQLEMAPGAAPSHQPSLTVEDLREMLQRMRTPQPPQAPEDVRTPSCGKEQLQLELQQLREQIEELQHCMRDCRGMPSCNAGPNCEANHSPPNAPTGKHSRRIQEPAGSAPWPTPTPDYNSQIRPRANAQAVGYTAATAQPVIREPQAASQQPAPIREPQPVVKMKTKRGPSIKGLN